MQRIWKLFKKELMHNIRDKNGSIMMILFPIILMLILGTALSGMFESNVTFDNVKIIYSIDNKSESDNDRLDGKDNILQAFNSFIEQGKSMKIAFLDIENDKEGIERIKDAGVTAFVHVNKQDNTLRLYKNETYNFEANFVESILLAFVGRYNAISELAKENPAYLKSIIKDQLSKSNFRKGFTEIMTLNRSRQPRAIDHYAVAILTMILMYSSLAGSSSIKNEQNLKTGNRLLCANVKKHELLIAKVFGSIFVTMLQGSIVIIFSKYVLKAYWGSHMGIILLIVLCETIMAVSIGTGIAFVIKNESVSSGIINTIIPVMVFLGGGYIPLDSFGSALLQLSTISPIKWINQSIFRIIYNNDFSYVTVAVSISLAIAAIFIILSSLLYRKESV